MDPTVLAIAAVAVTFVGALVLLLVRSSRAAARPLSGDAPLPPLPAPRPPEAPAAPTLFGRLADGLARTRDRMVDRIDALFAGRKVIDDALWHELEELLITSDVGVRTSHRLLEHLRGTCAREALTDPARLRAHLKAAVAEVLLRRRQPLATPGRPGAPSVIVVVGVNGAGKTTTIGKLAARHARAGRKVIVAAGDTFRAAAIEQLVVWSQRAGAEVVRHDQGADPAAVAHDALQAALSRGAELVICDTAGRLHTKTDLMAELQKVHRVVSRVVPGAPHEVLLVLDATSGQNAIAQAREFSAAVGVTGIALTKLDGTAKGGVIVGIADELDIPVKLIGIGEAVDDLRDFDAQAFVDALFEGGASALGRGGNSASQAARDEAAGIRAEDPR
jgi:fused signal recognition particle receptor